MAILSDYTAGTVTVSAGGTAVTGVGTAWLTAGFREGDVFIAADWYGIVQSVNSNTSLTLYPVGRRGGALSGASYRLRYMSDGSRSTAQARELINLLGGSGNLQALGGLVGVPNVMPYFTGAGTMDVTPLTAFARTLLDDVDGPTAYGTLGQIPNSQVRDDLPPDKAFRRGNVVGTVSQSGGLPTGAIIERGSNANGEYTRFADGTQICTRTISHDLTTTAVAVHSTASNFSAGQFVPSGGPVSGFTVADISALRTLIIDQTSNGWRVRTAGPRGSSTAAVIRLSAIGVWF